MEAGVTRFGAQGLDLHCPRLMSAANELSHRVEEVSASYLGCQEGEEFESDQRRCAVVGQGIGESGAMRHRCSTDHRHSGCYLGWSVDRSLLCHVDGGTELCACETS